VPFKSPDPVDVQVGSRIRLLRQGAGMYQTALAEHLGVTHQMVRRYEQGLTRVGPGRLIEIAALLRVPVSELLGDDGAAQSNHPAVHEAPSPLKLLTPPGALRLLKAYARIDNGNQRRTIVTLVERIASGSGK
jgi:transcriptional regulator with XRE-family HTH domain